MRWLSGIMPGPGFAVVCETNLTEVARMMYPLPDQTDLRPASSRITIPGARMANPATLTLTAADQAWKWAIAP